MPSKRRLLMGSTIWKPGSYIGNQSLCLGSGLPGFQNRITSFVQVKDAPERGDAAFMLFGRAAQDLFQQGLVRRLRIPHDKAEPRPWLFVEESFCSRLGSMCIVAIYWEPTEQDWVATKGLNLSYQIPETILLTIYPYYGNLN